MVEDEFVVSKIDLSLLKHAKLNAPLRWSCWCGVLLGHYRNCHEDGCQGDDSSIHGFVCGGVGLRDRKAGQRNRPLI